MSAGRTEAPTPRRLREARRRGEIACSRELTSAAALVGGVVACAIGGPAMARALAAGLRSSLAAASTAADQPELGRVAWPALAAAATLLARTALLPCSAAALAAAAAGALQARGLFAPGAVAFRLDRLAPGKGLARLLSGERWGGAALALPRAALTLGVGWLVTRRDLPALVQAPRLEPAALLRLLAPGAVRLALPLGLLLVAAGALDLAWAARRHRRALMMTRGERLREQRDEQGDPRLGAERRRLHRALAEVEPLRRATCLVVNPTHLAVALRHARGSEDPPVVLAKAAGPSAARLRREARLAGVPVVRDVALARALFRLAEVGDAIPVELYDAAAAVLVHVHGAGGEVVP